MGSQNNPMNPDLLYNSIPRHKIAKKLTEHSLYKELRRDSKGTIYIMNKKGTLKKATEAELQKLIEEYAAEANRKEKEKLLK